MRTDFYKVQELKDSESRKVNGGYFLWIGSALMYYCWEFATNPQAHINAFKEGMEMAKK